jgi:hypothetical protein
MLKAAIYVLVYNGVHDDIPLPCYAESFSDAGEMALDFVRREFANGDRKLKATRTDRKIKVVDTIRCMVYVFDIILYTS